MAKQNVGFGERHLEKFVVGVAGAVLAAMVFLFVVQSPYGVDVSGETLGPGDFYARLDEQARQKLSALKTAQVGESDQPPWKPPQMNQRSAGDIPVVFASINPPVPKLEVGAGGGGQLELVGILPPGKPAATTGRAYADIPEPQVKVIGDRQPAPPVQTAIPEPKDCYWVSVFATVPRKAQQQAFINANYAVDRQLLIVTNVEAERQRLLPGGEWASPEKVVRAFAPIVLAGTRTLQLTRQNGVLTIDPEEYRIIEMYKQEAVMSQASILRPPFQTALPVESQLEWTVPESMPGGVTFKWLEDYGVSMPAPEDQVQAGTKEGAAPPRLDYRKAKGEIDALVNKNKFVEAGKKVDEVLQGNPNLPPNQKKELEELAAQLEPKIQQETLRAEQERARRQQAELTTLGAETDLLWMTDLSVTPGEVYRYRVRLVALNPYAGVTRKLKNPEDAAKVLLTGDWSDWSDPAAVKPRSYLFCTGLEQDQVKIELNQWTQGQWDKTIQTLGLGQPMTFQDKLKEFEFEAVASAIDPAVKWEERTADPKRGISYKEAREVSAVLLVRDDGEVLEHIPPEDLKKRRELASELAPKNRDIQRRALTPGQMPDRGGPRYPGPGYPGPGYPGPGGGRFRDEG